MRPTASSVQPPRQSHVKELAGLSRQTHLDIAQGLALGQLREGHDAKQLGATETAHPISPP